MSNETKAMVNEWVQKDGGNVEKTARWMGRTLRLGSLKDCLQLIADAREGN